MRKLQTLGLSQEPGVWGNRAACLVGERIAIIGGSVVQ